MVWVLGVRLPYFNPLGGGEGSTAVKEGGKKRFFLMLWWLFLVERGWTKATTCCWPTVEHWGLNVTRAGGHWPPLDPSTCNKKKKNFWNFFFLPLLFFYDPALLIAFASETFVRENINLLLIKWASPSAFREAHLASRCGGVEPFKFRLLCVSLRVRSKENVTSQLANSGLWNVGKMGSIHPRKSFVPEIIFPRRQQSTHNPPRWTDRFFFVVLMKGVDEFRLISTARY